MGVTVRELLKMDMLQDARLLAGGDGLDREVGRVNFTDCPIKFDDEEYALVRKGDLFLCSLYLMKDDEDKLYDLFYFYLMTGSSGCILTDAYLGENRLPQRVLELANQKKYPILMIPEELEYGELIREISELLILDRMDVVAENRLNQLLYDSLPVSEVIGLAKYLNRDFLRCYSACYFEAPGLDARRRKLLLGDFRACGGLRPLAYRSGGFVLLNYNDRNGYDALLGRVRATLESYGAPAMGVSAEFLQAGSFDVCLQQALCAFEMSSVLGEREVYYNDLSLYNVLFPIREQEYLREYCRKTLGPLREYGRQQGIDLTGTIEAYLKNDGDYKKTAALLFTHENTVRFRITKAKALLGLENSHFQFIERVSVALKADQLSELKK